MFQSGLLPKYIGNHYGISLIYMVIHELSNCNTNLSTQPSNLQVIKLQNPLYLTLISELFPEEDEKRIKRKGKNSDFRTHYVIMTQKNMTPAPCYLRHFQIFDKIGSFLKNFLNIFRINCIFEELSNLYLILLLIILFPLLLWITAENRTRPKNFFI